MRAKRGRFAGKYFRSAWERTKANRFSDAGIQPYISQGGPLRGRVFRSRTDYRAALRGRRRHQRRVDDKGQAGVEFGTPRRGARELSRADLRRAVDAAKGRRLVPLAVFGLVIDYSAGFSLRWRWFSYLVEVRLISNRLNRTSMSATEILNEITFGEFAAVTAVMVHDPRSR